MPVNARQNDKANRRWRRLQKRKSLQTAISEQVGHYNLVGHTTGFKVDTFYQVTWLVDGNAVGNQLVFIPSNECETITAEQWFNQMVQTIMFGFNIEQADIMVSEVQNDIKKVHPVPSN